MVPLSFSGIIKTEDPDLPAFYFDTFVNPISHCYAVKATVIYDEEFILY